MARNLVICLDGTGGQIRAKGNTNVVRLFTMLDLSRPSDQIAYYDPGVGTFADPGAWTPFGRWLSKTLGLAFGGGLKQNLGEAYTWLMQHWAPGDRVYIFGFSRGAYTARALVGMLRTIGLARPGAENLVPYLVDSYSRDLNEMHAVAEVIAQPVDVDKHTTVPITYLGLWDTVKAAGFFRRSIRWPYTRDLPNAERIRHAVSIDEHRRPFREYPIEQANTPGREEVWFAGVHSDVGGTFLDNDDLSTIALKWVTEQAVLDGMLVKRQKYAAECKVTEAAALGPIHKLGRGWDLLGRRRRPVPAAPVVHASVKARMARDTKYRPFEPASAEWVDREWTELKKPK